jgi:hypothetical protein
MGKPESEEVLCCARREKIHDSCTELTVVQHPIGLIIVVRRSAGAGRWLMVLAERCENH